MNTLRPCPKVGGRHGDSADDRGRQNFINDDIHAIFTLKSYAAISLAGAACLDAVFPGAINRMKGAIQHLTSTMAMTVLFAFPLWAIAMALWVWKVNRGMATTPPEALKHATDSPWRAESAKETYQKMEK